MAYNILCRVSGGVTGTREALLKSNGKVVEFETRDDASAECTRLYQNLSPYRTADFSYSVIEVTDDPVTFVI